MKIAWSFVFLGALVSLSLWIWMIFLGTGIGLFSFRIEQGQLPSIVEGTLGGLFAVIGLCVALLVGGAVASLHIGRGPKLHASLHGIAVWGVTVVFFALLSSTAIIQAAAGAGASIGVKAIASELARLNPRVVSDVKLLKGKIVSYLTVSENEKEAAENRKELEATATKLREATAMASLFLAGALFAGFVAAIFGSLAVSRIHFT